MSVDYRQQYKPDQLEPFWPNEIIKMNVVVLCTLAVIMLLAVLPVLLERLGLHGLMHEEEPANPHGATPVGIKPEWYFLAVYQYLRLMPSEFLGVSGKTWGVLTQGPIALLLVLLPFWYRRRAHRRLTALYLTAVSLAVALFLALTIWGGWPEVHGQGEKLAPFGHYFAEHPFFFIFAAAALLIFTALMIQERRAVRRVMGESQEEQQAQETKR